MLSCLISFPSFRFLQLDKLHNHLRAIESGRFSLQKSTKQMRRTIIQMMIGYHSLFVAVPNHCVIVNHDDFGLEFIPFFFSPLSLGLFEFDWLNPLFPVSSPPFSSFNHVNVVFKEPHSSKMWTPKAHEGSSLNNNCRCMTGLQPLQWLLLLLLPLDQ